MVQDVSFAREICLREHIPGILCDSEQRNTVIDPSVGGDWQERCSRRRPARYLWRLFGGGVGLITTALYGLLANIRPRELFAIRTAMLAVANLAAAFIFIGFAMVWWWHVCPCSLARSLAGG